MLRERVPERDELRVPVLRAVERPDFAPDFFFELELDRDFVELERVPVFRDAVLRVAVLRVAVLRVAVLRVAVLRVAALRVAALRVAVLRVAVLPPVVFFLAEDLRALVRLLAVLRAVARPPLAPAFFRWAVEPDFVFVFDLAPADFDFADDLRDVLDFFEDDLRVEPDFAELDLVELERDLGVPERDDELPDPDRDDDRVVAGTARVIAAGSSASVVELPPTPASPHVDSAGDGSSVPSDPHEPVEALSASPVPLQSSWVTTTSCSDCACTIPYHVRL